MTQVSLFKQVSLSSPLYNPQFSTQISNWYERWEEMLSGPLEDTVDILAELKSNKVPLFILSNCSAETYPKAEAIYDFLHWSDGKIISGEIGKIKLDPDIYKLLIETYDLSPSNTDLIDDKLAYVEAAVNSGIYGINFQNAAELNNDLAKFELL
jgi:2-haloacid dehalogenase